MLLLNKDALFLYSCKKFIVQDPFCGIIAFATKNNFLRWGGETTITKSLLSWGEAGELND
jgi:hypothetical protein